MNYSRLILSFIFAITSLENCFVWADDQGCLTQWSVHHSKLTFQWKPTVCKFGMGCRVAPKPEFGIHGLWPQKTNSNSGDLAHCCTKQKFNLDDFDRTTRDSLSRNWPSMSNRPDHLFWKYEWEKHGTCATNLGLASPRKYFDFALMKFKQLNPMEALNKFNIVPGYQRFYKGSEIQEALSYNHGKEVALHCKVELVSNYTFLYEVYACYDSHWKPVDCPPSKRVCLEKMMVLPV